MAFRLLRIGTMGVAVTVVTTLLPSVPVAQSRHPWPDTYVGRLQALALIQTLNAEILATRSATATLERWCRDHAIAPDPKIVARPLPGPGPAPTDEQRARLRIGPTDEVRYRRVQLRCGARVLSVAENWYVPSRLTAEMNGQLLNTDLPFGRVIEPLRPYRRPLGSELLWSPLPAGWERRSRSRSVIGNRTLEMPDAMFTTTALVHSEDGRPLADVREVYQRDILAFPPPTP
jgi:hypothetical protein